ncbi:unnamed protein product, partial [marine sediment metagenome]
YYELYHYSPYIDSHIRTIEIHLQLSNLFLWHQRSIP